MGNNPYRELANDDDDDNTADNTNIETLAAPAAIPETILDADDEITGVVDGETKVVQDEQTGLATPDNEEITGVMDTEADSMADIDAAIVEVSNTLDQKLREANEEPDET